MDEQESANIPAVIIIMSPDDIIISPDKLHPITQFLEKKQIIVRQKKTIVENHCMQFFCATSEDLYQLQTDLAHIMAVYQIDIAVLPAENRQKKLLISDMDSTMIQQECIDELADFIGKKAEISRITEDAMQGKLNFEESLTQRVLRLKGLAEAKLEQCYQDKITLMPGAKELIDFMNMHHNITILVSGGFTFFARKIASTLGFQHYYANELQFNADKVLDGHVKRPILGREAKAEILQNYAQKHQIPLSECLAVGDGANDLAMLQLAGLGVAYHAKPAVYRNARIVINFCDLKSLVYIQV